MREQLVAHGMQVFVAKAYLICKAFLPEQHCSVLTKKSASFEVVMTDAVLKLDDCLQQRRRGIRAR
ncbi:hypothetical protein IGB42_02648 [Andreprevotia sp. IGB-42]|nr:hypothetical protein IGB42_02648 [Andreprevotia sp. IGB-42]